MKVLNVLSLAAAATALPIHANVRVVSVNKDGEQSVKSFENVDLGDTYESALEVLNELAHPGPNAVMNEEGQKKIEEVVEHKEAEVKDTIQDLKQQAGELVEQTKNSLQESYEKASEHLRKFMSEDETVHQKSEKKAHPKMMHGMMGKPGRIVLASEGHHKVRPHGVQVHRKGPGCSKKAKQMKGESYVNSMKQWSQGLYQDVSNIDFKQSFANIAQDEDAFCAVFAGFIAGTGLLALMTILIAIMRSGNTRSVQLTEDEEEETLMSEKQ